MTDTSTLILRLEAAATTETERYGSRKFGWMVDVRQEDLRGLTDQRSQDAEKIKRLEYALKRTRTMAENAVYRIGRVGQAPSLADMQQGFSDIAAEADEALRASQAAPTQSQEKSR